METLLATVALMGLIMLGMAVGVIFRGQELQGSCGGVGGGDCFCDKNGLPRACELGDKPPTECPDHDHDSGVRVTERGLVIK